MQKTAVKLSALFFYLGSKHLRSRNVLFKHIPSEDSAESRNKKIGRHTNRVQLDYT